MSTSQNLEQLIVQLESHLEEQRYHLISGTIAIIVIALEHKIACSDDLFNRFCVAFTRIRVKFDDCLSSINYSERHFEDQWQIHFGNLKKALEKHPTLVKYTQSSDPDNVFNCLAGTVALIKPQVNSKIPDALLSEEQFTYLTTVLQEAIRLPSLSQLDKQKALIVTIYQVVYPYWFTLRLKKRTNIHLNEKMVMVTEAIDYLIHHLGVSHRKENRDKKWERRCWGVIFQHLDFLGATPHSFNIFYEKPENLENTESWSKGYCHEALLLHSIQGWLKEDATLINDILAYVVKLNQEFCQSKPYSASLFRIDNYAEKLNEIRQKSFEKSESSALQIFSDKRRELLAELIECSRLWLPLQTNPDEVNILGSNSNSMCLPFSDMELAYLYAEDDEDYQQLFSQVYQLYVLSLHETEYLKDNKDGCRLDDSAPLKDWTGNPENLILLKMVSLERDEDIECLLAHEKEIHYFLKRLNQLDNLTLYSGYSLLFSEPLNPNFDIIKQPLYQRFCQIREEFLDKTIPSNAIEDLTIFVNPLPLLRQWNDIKKALSLIKNHKLNSKIEEIEKKLRDKIGFYFNDFALLAQINDATIDSVIEASPTFQDAKAIMQLRANVEDWQQWLNFSDAELKERLNEQFDCLSPIIRRLANKEKLKAASHVTYRTTVTLLSLSDVLRKSIEGKEGSPGILQSELMLSKENCIGNPNFKDTFYKPFNYFLLSLKLFHRLEQKQPLKIIEEAKAKYIISEEFAGWLRVAFEFIIVNRINLHLKYQNQREPLGDIIAINKTALHLIFEGFIHPMHQWVKEFILGFEFNPDKNFRFTSLKYMKPYFKALSRYSIRDLQAENNAWTTPFLEVIKSVPLELGDTLSNQERQVHFIQQLTKDLSFRNDKQNNLTCRLQGKYFDDRNLPEHWTSQFLDQEGEFLGQYSFKDIEGTSFLIEDEKANYIMTLFNNESACANYLFLMKFASILGWSISAPLEAARLIINRALQRTEKRCWVLLQENVVPNLNEDDTHERYGQVLLFLLLSSHGKKRPLSIFQQKLNSKLFFAIKPGFDERTYKFPKKREVSEYQFFINLHLLRNLPDPLVEKMLLIDPTLLHDTLISLRNDCNAIFSDIIQTEQENGLSAGLNSNPVDIDIDAIVIELYRLQAFFNQQKALHRPIFARDVLLILQPKIAEICIPNIIELKNLKQQSHENNIEISYLNSWPDDLRTHLFSPAFKQACELSIRPSCFAKELSRPQFFATLDFSDKNKQVFFLSIIKNAASSDVTVLDLKHSLIDDETIEVIVKNFPNLMVINVSSCHNLTTKGVMYLGQCSQLKELYLDDNPQIEQLNIKSKNLFPRLEKLSLQSQSSSIKNIDVTGILTLKELRLSGKPKVVKAEHYCEYFYKKANTLYLTCKNNKQILEKSLNYIDFAEAFLANGTLKNLTVKIIRLKTSIQSLLKKLDAKNQYFDSEVYSDSETLKTLSLGSSLDSYKTSSSWSKITMSGLRENAQYLKDMENSPYHVVMTENETGVAPELIWELAFRGIELSKVSPSHGLWLMVQQKDGRWVGAIIKRLHHESAPILAMICDPVNGAADYEIIHQAFVTWSRSAINSSENVIQPLTTVNVESMLSQHLAIKRFYPDGQDNALTFDGWYSSDICSHLLYRLKNTHHWIRYVFNEDDSNNTISFKNQFKLLAQLSLILERPLIFISKEPGANNHFICAVVHEKRLLWINPLGKKGPEYPRDETLCYTVLNELKNEGLITEIYSSVNPMQKHGYEEEGLVSCGPISLELASYFSEGLSKESFLTFWKGLPNACKENSEFGFSYFEVDIEEILPDTLVKIQRCDIKNDYIKLIVALRQNHYDRLELLTNNDPKNEFLIEDLMFELQESKTEDCENQSKYEELLKELDNSASLSTAILTSRKIEIAQSKTWLIDAFANYLKGKYVSSISLESLPQKQEEIIINNSGYHSLSSEPINILQDTYYYYAKASLLEAIMSSELSYLEVWIPNEVILPLPADFVHNNKFLDQISPWLNEQEKLLSMCDGKTHRSLVALEEKINSGFKHLVAELEKNMLHYKDHSAFLEISIVEEKKKIFSTDQITKHYIHELVSQYSLPTKLDSTMDVSFLKLLNRQQKKEYARKRQYYRQCGYPFTIGTFEEVLAKVWSANKRYQLIEQLRSKPLKAMMGLPDKTQEAILMYSLSANIQDIKQRPITLTALLNQKWGAYELLKQRSTFALEVAHFLNESANFEWYPILFGDESEIDECEARLIEQYKGELGEREKLIKEIRVRQVQIDAVRKRASFWDMIKERRVEFSSDVRRSLVEAYKSCLEALVEELNNQFETNEKTYWRGQIVYRLKHPEIWEVIRKDAERVLRKELWYYQENVLLVFWGENLKLNAILRKLNSKLKKSDEKLVNFHKKLKSLSERRALLRRDKINKAEELLSQEKIPLPWHPCKNEVLNAELLSQMQLPFLCKHKEELSLVSELPLMHGVADDGNTLLHGLVIKGHWDIVMFFLRNKQWHFRRNHNNETMFEVRDQNGLTIIPYLFKNKEWDILYELIPQLPTSVFWINDMDGNVVFRMQDENGNTLLHQVFDTMLAQWGKSNHLVHLVIDTMLKQGAIPLIKGSIEFRNKSVWQIMQEVIVGKGALPETKKKAYQAKVQEMIKCIKNTVLYTEGAQQRMELMNFPCKSFRADIMADLKSLHRMIQNNGSETFMFVSEAKNIFVKASWFLSTAHARKDLISQVKVFLWKIESAWMRAVEQRDDRILIKEINTLRAQLLPSIQQGDGKLARIDAACQRSLKIALRSPDTSMTFNNEEIIITNVQHNTAANQHNISEEQNSEINSMTPSTKKI